MKMRKTRELKRKYPLSIGEQLQKNYLEGHMKVEYWQMRLDKAIKAQNSGIYEGELALLCLNEIYKCRNKIEELKGE